MRGATTALAAIGLVAACGGPEPAASSFALTSPGVVSVSSTAPAGSTTTQPATTAPDSSTGSAPETSTTSSTGEAQTTGPLRDLGSVDFGDPLPEGCKGKIDFLFVISRFGPMWKIQDRVVAALPEFIETIESKFADFDYHIMVVDSDSHWGDTDCNEDCSPDACPIEGYPCDLLEQVTECDVTMGAGVVFPAGWDASNKPCPMAGGRRYFTREQPDPVGTFACAATLGSGGGDRNGEAMAAAVSPELSGPGGCNEGFIRDDALLMVTFIAYSYDYTSAGKPKLWAQALMDAKHDDPNAVVLFSILDPTCPPQDRICDLVKHYFPHWYISESSAPDYAPAFEIATDLVLDACSSFIPQ